MDTVIIGAGISGLSFAHYSKRKYVILEKEGHCGGLCRSFIIEGSTFDFSGHFLHLHQPDVLLLIKNLLKKNLNQINRDARIFTNDSLINYPFQANLNGLPDKIKNECLYGFLKKPSSLNKVKNFYEWATATFGKGITAHFMKPYNEKLWTVSSRTLTADWVAPFVPQLSNREVLSGYFGRQSKTFGYNASFYYPKKGGCQALIDAFSSKLKNLHLKTSAERINYKKKFIETSTGKVFQYNHLVSTQPLPELLRQISDLPDEINAASSRLSWNAVYCLNLTIKSGPTYRKNSPHCHWVYFPENKFIFYRAGIYTNIDTAMAPEGCSSFYIEISRRPGETFNFRESFRSVIEGLKEAELLVDSDKIKTYKWLSMPYAYVIYDSHRKKAVDTIQNFLLKNDVHSIGRYGGWEYSFMEKSIIQGKETADFLNEHH